MSPEAALTWCRFTHDAATMVLWGASALLAFLVPGRLGREIGMALTPLLAGMVVLSVVTTFIALPVEVAGIGTGWEDAVDIDVVRSGLFETSVGRAWMTQVLVASVLAVATLSPVRVRMACVAVASGLLLAMLASQGHAVMQEGWMGVLHRANDAMHVLAAGAWLGALPPLLPILRALIARITTGRQALRFEGSRLPATSPSCWSSRRG